MKTEIYLILNKHGVVGYRRNKPSLSSGQVAVKVKLDISDKFFERFVPEADLIITDNYVIKPDIKVSLTEGVVDRLLDTK